MGLHEDTIYYNNNVIHFDNDVSSLFFKYNEYSSKKDILMALKSLTCIYVMSKNQAVSINKLAEILNFSNYSTKKVLNYLLHCSIAVKEPIKKRYFYKLSTKGVLLLTAFDEFKDIEKIKIFLANKEKRKDKLAYILLVIGCIHPKNKFIIYDLLKRYCSKGYTFENISSDVIATIILNFYIFESKNSAESIPNYLTVFKEFTSEGFQEIFKILLYSTKPSFEDYNWLVEFFYEIVEFYYNPFRIAYTILVGENVKLKKRLTEYIELKEKQIKKNDSKIEVTLDIPVSNKDKIFKMPPHLRVVATRLIIEPLQFIDQELSFYFWES